MKAKKLTTEEEDGVSMVLKGAEHITSSITVESQLKASSASTLHKWGTLDSRINISTNRYNCDNKSNTLDNKRSKSNQKDIQIVHANSSFLSRFIEFRNNDKLSKMTSGSQNGSVEREEVSILLESSVSDSTVTESSKNDVESPISDATLGDQLDNSSTQITRDTLSRTAVKKQEDVTQGQEDVKSIKQSAKYVVKDSQVKSTPVKIRPTRRVEELRIRIENCVESSPAEESVKSGSPKSKYFKAKSPVETKEDGGKTDGKKNGSSTRDSPPRKVSFKVRSGSANGRIASSSLSTSSRRSAGSNKTLFIDGRISNLSSSKVAALASKFNAIIHENKDDKKIDIAQNESKKTLSVATGSPVTTSKKTPSTEKTFVSRRNSSNSKRDSCSLSTASRKHSSTKQPLLEAEDNQKVPPNNNTRDHKRRVNVSYRPSTAGMKSGNVKAAIQIFEKNSTIAPSVKSNVIVSSGNKKTVSNSNVVDSKQSIDAPETKKEPNYPRVIFKREATLVRVTLECEDVCNEEQSIKDKIRNETNKCQQTNIEVQSEEVTVHQEVDKEEKGDESDNVTVVIIGEESDQNNKDKKQTKIKPAVPAKTVTKDRVYKTLQFTKDEEKDINYVKVMCKADTENNYRTPSKECITDDKKLVEGEKSTLPAASESTDKTHASLEQREKDSMMPNRSFLWGTTPPGSKVRTPDEQPTIVPVTILTKDHDSTNTQDPVQVNNNINSEDYIYDDVYPPSSTYSNGSSSVHGYAILDPEDDVYDDVGPPVTEDEAPPSRMLPTVTVVVSSGKEGDGNDSGYDYCGGSGEPPLDQNYDDCEGEGYQCIGEGSTHEDAESNIYDDVKSVRIADDVASISNCYESIYSGGERPVPGENGAASSSASSSIGSGNHSFCDQSNSLYGVGGSRFDSASVSQASTVSAEDGPHEVLSYQLTAIGPGQPRSETSDEWVDVEMTESEGEAGDDAIAVNQGRPKCRKSPRRSRKVRKSWSKSARKATGNAVGVYVSSSSVLYLGALDPPLDKPSVSSHQRRSEAVGLVSLRAILYIGDAHESQEMTFFLEKEGGDHSSDSDADHHYEMLYEVVGNNKEDIAPYDDFDSFDSDVSDETYIKPLHQEGYDIANGRLPEPPAGQNIYGISKIAEAAGKKMLKLGKSLRKIRNKRNNNNAAGVQLKTCPPLPTTPRPPPPSPPPPALPSPPVPPPRISEKSVSSGNLAGRKYWSLRKFKRSVSASDQTPPSSPASGPKKETATFYLTPALDADTGGVEGSSGRRLTDTTDICSENGDTPTSPSSMSSSKTVVYDSGMEANYSQDMVQKTVANTTTNKKQRPTSAPERRSSGNIRPNSPPPLPPHSSSSADAPKRPARKEKRNSGSTSWYAECGLFDQTADAQNIAIVDTPKRNVKKPDRPISNSWYAEVGLWDMSTSSPNDSSLSEQDARSQHTDLSGGDSPLTAGSPENSGVVERRFADEPLYQFYTAAVVERDMRSELDSDGYEEIGDNSRKPKQSRPTAMELIRPRDGQHRTLWCEIPEVVNSRVLSTISPHQKKLQEAKFEIITSEASYMNSLNVLEKHFISSLELCDESVLSKNDKRTLFSNLIPVKSCSENFLAELEACWQDNILLHGICEVVLKHASNNFNVYIKYCSNQICLDRTLRGLKEQNGKFAEVLAQLESGPVCQALSLHSFLMLPMQRITRLPLLIDAVLTRLDPQDDEYNTCRLALATLNKIVQNCNEDARRMERMEEILILSPQLYFPSEVKAVPIISSARWLVKKGELTQLVWRGDEGKLTFGKKFSRVTIHMFLFTDLLVITKKKRKTTPDATGDECYAVIDYCPRNLVQMTSAEGMSNLPVKFTSEGGRNLMLLTMLQNHEKKTVEMILSCSMESDRQRWLEAVNPPVSDNPDETVYEEWDCPQVTAVHPYVARQPDELSLEVADVVNVLRKITDGWYLGERIRDGEKGWFPGNHTVEVLSAHVRARNLKQRYRLLALSGNFLESQRKEKQAK
ncbi:uncharacterized protein Exn isoform X2 [Periplaneta americana]|uniref:uncharacterized protein Exn isoform X2 n=1 Tax=Periplaneta americana TaxID=6978 RepID=UPI0037E7E5AC